MSFDSREFVASASIGDAEKCAELRAAMHPELDAEYEAGRIEGYSCEIFADAGDLAEADVFKDPILAVTGGTYPCLWINVSWSGAAPAFLGAFASKHGLTVTNERQP